MNTILSFLLLKLYVYILLLCVGKGDIALNVHPCTNNGEQAAGTLFYHSDLMKHSWSLNLALSWQLTTSRIFLSPHTQRSQADIIWLFTWVLRI